MREDTTENYSEDAFIGHTSLSNLHLVLQNIFLPFLSDQNGQEDENNNTNNQKYGETLQNIHTLNSDFISHLKKFSGQVGYTVKQLSGEVLIDLPEVHLDDPKTAAEDEHVSFLFDT